MSRTDLIIHDEKDNVAVVVIDKTSKNQECTGWIMENDKTIKIKSISEIPLGHKIALQNLKEGFYLTTSQPPSSCALVSAICDNSPPIKITPAFPNKIPELNRKSCSQNPWIPSHTRKE